MELLGAITAGQEMERTILAMRMERLPPQFKEAIAYARGRSRGTGRRYHVGWSGREWVATPYAPGSTRAARPWGCTVCGTVGTASGMKCEGPWHKKWDPIYRATFKAEWEAAGARLAEYRSQWYG